MTDDPNDGLIRCDACPVLCRIRDGKTGACDRYANVDGVLTRMDPLVVTQKVVDDNGRVVPFLAAAEDWDGSLISQAPTSNSVKTTSQKPSPSSNSKPSRSRRTKSSWRAPTSGEPRSNASRAPVAATATSAVYARSDTRIGRPRRKALTAR